MIVESPVELKDHGRLLIVRWWLTLALLETGLILAGVLSLVSGSALRDRDPRPGANATTVSIILDLELSFCELENCVRFSMAGRFHFNVFTIPHIPFHDRGVHGPVTFKYDNAAVELPTTHQLPLYCSIICYRCCG